MYLTFLVHANAITGRLCERRLVTNFTIVYLIPLCGWVGMARPGVNFQKKSRSKIPYIPYTKPSIQNSQLLISSGIPSLDYILGGGIAVGTLVLIEEDVYGTFAKVILKYYMAEGVVSGHTLLTASLDDDESVLVHQLPALLTEKDRSSSSALRDVRVEPSGGPEPMKIAWRYENLGQVQSTVNISQFGHYYDVSKLMEIDLLARADIQHWSGTRCVQKQQSGADVYKDLLKTIVQTIRSEEFSVGCEGEKKKNILRLALHSLGSSLWGDEGPHWTSDRRDLQSLLQFFYALRALLRVSYAIGVVSVPSHLFHNPALVYRLHHLSDVVLKIESFAGSDRETNPVFRDYHGLFHVIKLPAINTLAPHIPESRDLAFKMKRKMFIIEKLHLPPELSETTQREQDDPVLPRPQMTGCGTLPGGKSIDF